MMHDLDEQVWLVTRRRKEITSSAEMRANGSVLLQQQGSARGLFRSGCHRYHAGVLKSALGGNREYFHSQTLGDSERLKAGETGDFI